MNEKGFAATSILYTILVVFILIMFSMISLFYSRNNLLNKIQDNIKDDIQDILQQYEVYENGSVVYFNPETATVCSPANAVSTTGTKTGCMKWYIFNDYNSNGYVNLLLDHNTTDTVAWNSSGNNSDGINEVRNALNDDISTWNDDVKSTARLITAPEIALISGNVAFNLTSSTYNDGFYFGTNNKYDTSLRKNYTWLYDYTDCSLSQCKVSDIKVKGYWTPNPVYGSAELAWMVTNVGSLSYNNIDQTNGYGVRPVIQVSKNNIIVNPTNLVVNSDLALKNNTNFPDFKYGEDEFGGYVSHTSDTAGTLIVNDEFIAVDTSKNYLLSMDFKSSNTTSTYFAGIAEYDIDKRLIAANNYMYVSGSLTSLSKDLKQGDTVVYLNDVSGFQVTSSTPSYQRGFIFWDYKDSTGYQYPEGTYSQNVFNNLFDYGSIDTVNNTITLKKAWTGNTITAGTQLSQCSSGSGYNYSLRNNNTLSTSWNTYSSNITGVISSGRDESLKFRPGTVYVKLLILFNYNNTAATTLQLKNISLTVIE